MADIAEAADKDVAALAIAYEIAEGSMPSGFEQEEYVRAFTNRVILIYQAISKGETLTEEDVKKIIVP